MSLFDGMPLVPQSAVQPITMQPTAPKRGLEGLLARIRGGLATAGQGIMPEPKGLEGLISPEDLAAARSQGLMGLGMSLLGDSGWTTAAERPTLGQSLARGVAAGQGAYSGAIGDRLAQMQTGMQFKDMQTQMQQRQQILGVRKQIAEQFPAPANESPDQAIDRLKKIYVASVQGGDLEMAGKVGEVLKSIGNDRNVKQPDWVDFGGYKALMSPDGQELQRVAKTPNPRDPNAPDTASQLRDQRMFTREQQLADDYNKDTKAYREIHTGIKQALSGAPAAERGDPAAQVNLLYAFVKAMDPNSAVREGEIGLVNKAAPIFAQASAMINKYQQGDRSFAVPPAMVRSMANLMRERNRGIGDYIRERGDYYSTRARRWGLDTGDLFSPPEEPTSAPVSGVRGGVTGSRIRGAIR